MAEFWLVPCCCIFSLIFIFILFYCLPVPLAIITVVFPGIIAAQPALCLGLGIPLVDTAEHLGRGWAVVGQLPAERRRR